MSRSALPRRPRASSLAVALGALLAACGDAPRSGAGDGAAPAAVSPAPRAPVPPPALPGALAPLPAHAGATATAVRVARDTTTFGTGPAWVRLSTGDSLQVADSAFRAWRLGDGALVAWSGLDGAGGFENEGQSLTVLDVATGRRQRVVADYFMIEDVTEVRDGAARALVVHMQDGGRGAVHVAVVDPARGTVFRATNARATANGATIVVDSFEDTDRPATRGDRRTPTRRDTIAVASVAGRGVVTVPRSGP